MKKMTAFVTIALLVCIATFALIAFAHNQNRNENRNASDSYLTVDNDDDFPGKYSAEDNQGEDSEGPLYSIGSSWTGYSFNDNGELRVGASGWGYLSCSTDNENYRTRYSLHAKVPDNLQNPSERNPQTLPRDGSFSDCVTVSGEGNGNAFNLGGASGSASASGKNPSNEAQHNTSAASPTPVTARNLVKICDWCGWDEGCSGCE